MALNDLYILEKFVLFKLKNWYKKLCGLINWKRVL